MFDTLGLGLLAATLGYVVFLVERHGGRPRLRPLRLGLALVSFVLFMVTVVTR